MAEGRRSELGGYEEEGTGRPQTATPMRDEIVDECSRCSVEAKDPVGPSAAHVQVAVGPEGEAGRIGQAMAEGERADERPILPVVSLDSMAQLAAHEQVVAGAERQSQRES